MDKGIVPVSLVDKLKAAALVSHRPVPRHLVHPLQRHQGALHRSARAPRLRPRRGPEAHRGKNHAARRAARDQLHAARRGAELPAAAGTGVRSASARRSCSPQAGFPGGQRASRASSISIFRCRSSRTSPSNCRPCGRRLSASRSALTKQEQKIWLASMRELGYRHLPLELGGRLQRSEHLPRDVHHRQRQQPHRLGEQALRRTHRRCRARGGRRESDTPFSAKPRSCSSPRSRRSSRCITTSASSSGADELEGRAEQPHRRSSVPGDVLGAVALGGCAARLVRQNPRPAASCSRIPAPAPHERPRTGTPLRCPRPGCFIIW